MTEVNEDGDDDEDDELIEDEADSTEDELQKRFDRMTFVVATRKLEQLPQWVKVTEVFKTRQDAPFLKRAGIERFNDPATRSTASGSPACAASASTSTGWTCWSGGSPTTRSPRSSSG